MNGHRRKHRHTCSPVSAADRCRPRASARYSSASASAPACPSRSSRTCYGTPVATPWPMPGRHAGAASMARPQETSTRSGTPSWRRTGSKTSGAIRQPKPISCPQAANGCMRSSMTPLTHCHRSFDHIGLVPVVLAHPLNKQELAISGRFIRNAVGRAWHDFVSLADSKHVSMVGTTGLDRENTL